MTETPKRLVHLCVANHTNATGPSFASYTLDPCKSLSDDQHDRLLTWLYARRPSPGKGCLFTELIRFWVFNPDAPSSRKYDWFSSLKLTDKQTVRRIYDVATSLARTVSGRTAVVFLNCYLPVRACSAGGWPGDKAYEAYARTLLDAEQPTAPAVSTSTTPTPPAPMPDELSLPSRDLTLKEIVTLHDFHAKQMTVLGKRYASAVSEMYRDDLNREGIPHHAGIALRALRLNKRVCKLMKKRAGGLASLGFEVKREKARIVSGYTMQSGSDTGSDSDESESDSNHDSDSDSDDGQDHPMHKYVVTSPLFL